MYNINIAKWSHLLYAVIAAFVFCSCFYTIPVSLTELEMGIIALVYLVIHVALYQWVDTNCYRAWYAASEQTINHTEHTNMLNRVRHQVDSMGWAITLIDSALIAGVICQMSIGVGNAIVVTGLFSIIGCSFIASNVVHYIQTWIKSEETNCQSTQPV